MFVDGICYNRGEFRGVSVLKRRLFAAILCLVLLVSVFAVPASAASLKIMKINVSGARLRSGPGDYSVIKSLKKGTKVLYTGKKVDAFCQVRTSGGKVGYVYDKFLSAYGAADSSQVFYTNKATTMRRSNSSKSGKVKKLSKKTLVLVYNVKGSWAYCKTISGKGGYVKISALTKL